MTRRFARSLICTLFLSLGGIASAAAPSPLIPFQGSNGEWGYLDPVTHRPVITPQFADARPFKDGLGLVMYPNPNARSIEDRFLYDYVRPDGQTVFRELFRDIAPVFDDDKHELPNLREVTRPDGQIGIVSTQTGEWVVPPVTGRPGYVPTIRFHSEQSYLVDGRYLVVDGRRVDAPEGTRITSVDFEHRVLNIMRDTGDDSGPVGLANWQGQIMIPPDYLSLEYYPNLQRAIGIRFRNALARGIALFSFTHSGDIPSSTATTDLLDDQGRVIRSFGSGMEVSGLRDAIGYFKPSNDVADLQIRYFDMKTGKDLPASEVESVHGLHIFHRGDAGNVLFGLETTGGQPLIPPSYRSLSFVGKDLLVATDAATNKQGVIDTHGNVIAPFDYRAIRADGSGQLTASRDGQRFEALNLGGTAMKPTSSKAGPPSRRLVEVYRDGLNGVVDASGKTVIPTRYRSLTDTQELDGTDQRFYSAEDTNGRWGLLDASGKTVVPFEYGFVGVDKAPFAHGWVDVEDADRTHHGLVNIRTGVRVPTDYRELAVKARCIVATRYDRQDNTYTHQLLNFKGTPISGEFRYMDPLGTHHFIVTRDRLTGVIDDQGTLVVPLQYDYVWDRGGGLLEIQSGPRDFYIDLKGNVYLPR